MNKSTHQVISFKLTALHNIENADRIKLIKIPDSDYTYVANYEQWKDKIGKMICWAPPDSLVPTDRSEFEFLKQDAKYDENSQNPGKYARVKAKRFRGVLSFGVCCEAPDGVLEGEDCAELLGVKHYEIEENYSVKKDKLGLGSNEIASAPDLVVPKYDVDAFLKYGRSVFQEGELVNISEKIHGENACFVFKNEFHCRSRSIWKKEYASAPNITLEQLIENMTKSNLERPEEFRSSAEEIQTKANDIYQKRVVNFKTSQNEWWWLLHNTPNLKEFLQANPEVVVFGEKYGKVKGYPYDVEKEPFKLRCFDVMKGGQFLDIGEARELGKDLPWVPLLHEAWPMDFNNLEQWYNGKSTLNPKYIREGCVIRPLKERWNKSCGRVLLKLINPDY